MGFSIELEVVSLITLLVIGLFHYDRNNRQNIKYHWFNTCLVTSACAIIFNIITCIMMEDIAAYSIKLHMIANSIYFIAINTCMSLVAAYIFYLLFAHMREQKCYKIAMTLVGIMYTFEMVLVVLNVWTGCYFYFENNTYYRGPFNRVGFIIMLIEVCMLCSCYFKNRKLVTPYAGQLARMLPPIILVMTIMQMLMPSTLFTGTIAAMVNLIVFACFQNNRIGRDALTELPNRSSFFTRLEMYKKKDIPGHLILIHLSHFDKVNRRFQMKHGDSFLYHIARYLENVQGGYQVYRYGNTHFMMCGEFHTMEDADKLVDEIYDRFSKPWIIHGEKWIQQVQVVHMNLAAGTIDENYLTDQLNYLLLCSRKENDSSKLFFGNGVRCAYERKQFILQEVKKALQNESFVLHFQPVYSCKEDTYISAEVLLRLFAEDGTAISPAEFIPIAEEHGLADEISWFVLQKSMDFLKRHPEIPLESISINMSVEQMKDHNLDELLKAMKESYLDQVSRLRVEITENTITKNQELVANGMKVLVDTGLNFYLDDFGMGYSNFSRVFDLPFEIVKLDRSLMMKIDEDDKSYQIINSLVEMLHNAGFIVLAEGVERVSQVERAKKIGIDRIQGYYYARPMAEEAFVKFVMKDAKAH